MVRNDKSVLVSAVANTNPPFALIPAKPDAERAAEFKARITEVLKPFLALMDEAAQAGFLVRWQGIAPGAFGRHEIVDLHLLKRF